MKYFSFLILFLFIFSCNNNKSVYWCGDHACINKKEKEAYFKKTMIVEVKNVENVKDKDKSEINKIVEQAKLNEKRRIKKEKSLLKEEQLQEKIRIKSEKALAKQAKIDEKKRKKNEKKLLKQKKIEEKKQVKNEKILKKKNSSNGQKKVLLENNEELINKKIINNDSGTFSQIVKKIKQKNMIKEYPDINNLPN